MDKNLDPRVIRTRKYLRDALFELINIRGYEELTIQDITDRAGLNRATFYLHYKDKYDLLTKSMQEVYEELNSKINSFVITEISPYDPAPSLDYLFRHFSDYDQFYQIMLNEKTGSEFINHIRDLIAKESRVRFERYIKSKNVTVNDQNMIELIVNFSTGAIIGLMSWWLQNQKPLSPNQMSSYVGKFLMLGIFKSAGIEDFSS